MEPPGPSGARTVDDLVCRLRELRGWAGLSEREVHRQVVRSRRARGIPEIPSYDTVHRCFQLGRTRLNVDLVVDIACVLLGDKAAGAQWRTAHARIAGEAADAAVVTVSGVLPAELPEFTGRGAELAELAGGDVRDTPPEGHATEPRVAVIEGMAGIGKTTLAVRTAHHLARRRRFETTLWVNLRGFSTEAPPADPAAVLEGFLRQLGMSADRVRLLDLEARAREFRRRLTGRRALVVLDNAMDEDQVRHLLPGTPSGLTLITSRNSLSGLPGARRLRLEVFTPQEALDLLRGTTGADRIDSDPGTAALIAESVGHLPLALGVVAGRIKGSAGWTLADHLERLNGHRTQLKFDDRVELALSLSYEGLDTDCRRMFRLLSLHPGHDVDVHAAAALADSDLATTRRHLDTLLAANLLRRPAPHRYEFHDLVRIYAMGRAHDQDPGHARRAAFTRLLEHHWFTASLAMDHFAPHEAHHCPPTTAAPATAATPAPALADRAAATAWLDAECAGLIATAATAADHGDASHAGRLSTLLFRYLDTCGHYKDAETLHLHGARTPDPDDRAWALANLGVTYWRLGRPTETLERLTEALTLFRAAGDRTGEARALGSRGEVHQYLGHGPEAAENFMTVMRVIHDIATRPRQENAAEPGRHAIIYEPLGRYPKTFGDPEPTLALGAQLLADIRTIGDRVSEGRLLGSLGSIHRQLGHCPEALEHLRQSLSIARELGNYTGESDILIELALTERALPDEGASERALHYHRQAATLSADLGDRYQQARAHDGMAHCYTDLGDHEAARTHWQQALGLFTDLGTPETDLVTARMEALDAD